MELLRGVVVVEQEEEEEEEVGMLTPEATPRGGRGDVCACLLYCRMLVASSECVCERDRERGREGEGE